MTQNIEREVAGGGEKKSLGRAHRGAGGAGAQDAGEGLLHEIVDLDAAGKPAAQPRAQEWFVHDHVVVEPTVLGDGEASAGRKGVRNWMTETEHWLSLSAKLASFGLSARSRKQES